MDVNDNERFLRIKFAEHSDHDQKHEDKNPSVIKRQCENSIKFFEDRHARMGSRSSSKLKVYSFFIDHSEIELEIKR